MFKAEDERSVMQPIPMGTVPTIVFSKDKAESSRRNNTPSIRPESTKMCLTPASFKAPKHSLSPTVDENLIEPELPE